MNTEHTEKIISFLCENNARISFGDKWMVAELHGETVEYTVYQQGYGKKKPTILYDGSMLSRAIFFMENN